MVSVDVISSVTLFGAGVGNAVEGDINIFKVQPVRVGGTSNQVWHDGERETRSTVEVLQMLKPPWLLESVTFRHRSP